MIGVGINGFEMCEDDDRLGTIYDRIGDIKLKDEYISSKLYSRHVTLDTTTKANNRNAGGIWNSYNQFFNDVIFAKKNRVFIIVACIVLSMIICATFTYFESMWVMTKFRNIVARAKRIRIRMSGSKSENRPLLNRIIGNHNNIVTGGETEYRQHDINHASIDNQETTQNDEFYVAL